MNFERRFQSFQGRSAAAEAESPSARHAEIDTRIITQKGLAIAFASTVLQTQLVVLGEAGGHLRDGGGRGAGLPPRASSANLDRSLFDLEIRRRRARWL